MLKIFNTVSTIDEYHEVKGSIQGFEFDVLVRSRNGVVNSVSFQDERLNKYLTPREKEIITLFMKSKFSDPMKLDENSEVES